MIQKALLQKIKEQAIQDQKNRSDRRFSSSESFPKK